MPRIEDNREASRFEIFDGDERAGLIVYRLSGRELTLVHTEIDDRFAGRGLGTELVRGALKSARERGLAVLPECPFARSFIAEHPEYLELVPPAERERFGLPAAA